MKKQRINTTISLKHYELLKKHAEEFGTQQSVLEHALESLNSKLDQNYELSSEEELRIRVEKSNAACIVYKDLFKILMLTADIKQIRELVNRQKPIEFAIEYYFQKPLKECNLEEIIEGIVLNAKMTSWFDTVDYTDNDDHYMLNMTHSLGLNTSKTLKMAHESLFKTYGVNFKTTISEKTLFMKIFKNNE
jgi:hypothetical protein